MIVLVFACYGVFKPYLGVLFLVLIFCSPVYAIGVVLRFPLRKNLTSRKLFIVENLLVIVAPCGFIATEYMILGRLAVWLQCTRHLLVPANRITMVFLLSDIATFLLQVCFKPVISFANCANVGLFLGRRRRIGSFKDQGQRRRGCKHVSYGTRNLCLLTIRS